MILDTGQSAENPMRESRTSNLLRLGWIILLVVIFWQACSSTPHEASNLINDKVGHLLVFIVLGVLAHLAWETHDHRKWLVGFLVFYGLLIECVQYFVPGRFFSMLDWLMDILGLIIAVLLIKLHARTASGSVKKLP
jgi:VanZ family protein